MCRKPGLAALAAQLGISTAEVAALTGQECMQLRAEIDGRIAHVYGLTEAEFAHVLASFPLVDEQVKAATLVAYRNLAQAGNGCATGTALASR